MTKEDSLNELRQRLVGKRIVSIEPSNTPNAIGNVIGILTTEDDKAFRIHVTEHNCWTEDANLPDGTYGSLDALLNEYYRHNYSLRPLYRDDNPEPKVALESDRLTLTAPDNKVFEIKGHRLTDWEKRVCSDARGRGILGYSAMVGLGGVVMWKYS